MSLHPPPLKGVWPHVNGESEGRAALVGTLVAEERVHGHHLQVQRVLSGPGHSAGQHQHGADVVDLLGKKMEVEFSHCLNIMVIPSEKQILRIHPSEVMKTSSGGSYSDVEVSIFIPGADTEGVVSPRRDAGGLNLEDVRWDGALRRDAHVAVHDGERQVAAGGLVDWAHAAAVRE